jgi:hypothetical protein
MYFIEQSFLMKITHRREKYVNEILQHQKSLAIKRA